MEIRRAYHHCEKKNNFSCRTSKNSSQPICFVKHYITCEYEFSESISTSRSAVTRLWIQYRIYMNWCNRIKWAKKYLDLRRQKTKVRLELAGYHGQWSGKHECTIWFLYCLSKNACYLSINLFNNHNQWVWSLICCEYGICMQFVHSFGIPCTDRWSVEKVACGLWLLLHLTKIEFVTHSSNQSTPFECSICRLRAVE